MAVLWQTQGWTCGPENTGPPLGWLTIVSVSPSALGALATRVLSPSGRSVRSASKRPFGRSANALVTSVPPDLTVTEDALTPSGIATATRASPADTRSPRLDSTFNDSDGLAASATPVRHTLMSAPRTIPL